MTEIKPGKFFDADDFTITAFPVSHRGPDCLGYIFEEKSRRPFLSEKADALGVPFGPQRGKLVAGETIDLPDGRRIGPDDVLGELERGAKLVLTGDVGRTDDLVEHVREERLDVPLLVEARHGNGHDRPVRHVRKVSRGRDPQRERSFSSSPSTLAEGRPTRRQEAAVDRVLNRVRGNTVAPERVRERDGVAVRPRQSVLVVSSCRGT